MFKFSCKSTFYNLPPEAAERIIYQKKDCDFATDADNRLDLMKKIIEHATEVHGLEDRRLAPAVFMNRIEQHIQKE